MMVVDWYWEGVLIAKLAVSQKPSYRLMDHILFIRAEYTRLLGFTGQRKAVETYRQYLCGFAYALQSPMTDPEPACCPKCGRVNMVVFGDKLRNEPGVCENCDA